MIDIALWVFLGIIAIADLTLILLVTKHEKIKKDSKDEK